MIRFPTIGSRFSVLHKSGQAETNQGSGNVTEAGDGGLRVCTCCRRLSFSCSRAVALDTVGYIMTRATAILAVVQTRTVMKRVTKRVTNKEDTMNKRLIKCQFNFMSRTLLKLMRNLMSSDSAIPGL